MRDIYFHRTMAILVIGMILFSAIGMALSGIGVQPAQLLTKAALYLAILLGAWFYHRRGVPQFVGPLLLVFWLGLFSDLHIFPMFIAGKHGSTFYDATLASMDRWIGIETPQVMEWVAQFPLIQSFFHHTYSTLVFLMTLALLAPAFLGRSQAAKEFLLSCVFAVMICFPIFTVFQAQGPWTYYGYQPSINQDAYMHVFAQLKASPTFVMNLEYRNGLISFPSFHTILAFLAGVALWSIPYLRWIGAFWSISIVISTVTTGTHYLIDVIAGLATVIICTAGAKWWSRWERRKLDISQNVAQAEGHLTS